jgi:hypothetical protein
MAGALAPRTLIVVTTPSHNKQWGMASFMFRGEEGHCCSDSLKIEMAGYGAYGPVPRYSYYRGNRSGAR